MFAVTPAVADAIRQALQDHGELAAIVELRRHFPLFDSNEQARSCVLAIASWKPIPTPLPARLKKPRAEHPAQDWLARPTLVRNTLKVGRE